MTSPFDAIRAALAAGRKSISVPKATWTPEAPQGAGAYLELRGVRGVEIDFGGGELRGRTALRFFALERCEDVAIRNVVLDYDPLPFAQAEIVAVSPGSDWTMRPLGGYPAPGPALLDEVWPLQAYGRDSLELANPMRCGDGFRLERLPDGLYRASGGENRAGAVGDIAVWNVVTAGGEADLGGGADRDAVSLRRCSRCVLERVTVHSTPGGRAFEEHGCTATAYRRCRLRRRATVDDFAAREVPRLRSGGHDAFMSRRAVAGPSLVECEACHHCDDAVNVGGVYALVSAVRGRRVRLLELAPSPFAPGDAAEALSENGEPRRGYRVTAADGVRADATDAERAWAGTLGLWPGFAEKCRRVQEIELADAAGLVRGDALVSEKAQGAGFEIRDCLFGHNRAFGMRIRAPEGVIAGNRIENPELWGLFIGPEHEWLEGGMARDIRVEGNVFVGCRATLGGTAAHRRPIPQSAYRNVVFKDNLFV